MIINRIILLAIYLHRIYIHKFCGLYMKTQGNHQHNFNLFTEITESNIHILILFNMLQVHT